MSETQNCTDCMAFMDKGVCPYCEHQRKYKGASDVERDRELMSETKTQVKRFSTDYGCYECKEGNWVDFEDYATLTRERDNLTEKLTWQANRTIELTRERDSLREALAKFMRETEFKEKIAGSKGHLAEAYEHARQILSATEGRKA